MNILYWNIPLGIITPNGARGSKNLNVFPRCHRKSEREVARKIVDCFPQVAYL
jgi:hypothetical protein